MKTRVLLFAQLADAVGSREIDLELDEGASVDDLLDALGARHGAIADMRGRLAVAIDERYAAPGTRLEPGQTVALIPPVSGG